MKKKPEIKKPETFETLHGKPVTRRDFLSSGLMSFSATMFMPSMLTMMSRAGFAQAQEIICKAAGLTTLCPFISIKLSGGAAMGANFVPRDKGNQLLASYTKMGMGLAGRFTMESDFANKVGFYTGSQMLVGIRSVASINTRNSSHFVGMPVRSQDDTSMNMFDITGLVAKAGMAGKILPNLGTAGTATGVNNQPAYLKPPAPLVVGRYEDVVGSLGVTGALRQLSSAQKNSLFNTVRGISSVQAEKLQTMTGGDVLSRLVQCANMDNANLMNNSAALDIDPLSNAAFAQVWGITAATNKGSRDFVFATLVYNALNGNASTVNLEMGGYDYHNGTRSAGDNKDLEAGIVMGKVLQSMAVLSKKGFVVVTSDGSVTSSESNDPGAPWMSDRGTAGVAYMIGYDPAGQARVNRNQVGQFTEGQAADDTFITGSSPQLAGAGMLANYLAFNKSAGALETLLPRVFTDAQKDQIIVFG